MAQNIFLLMSHFTMRRIIHNDDVLYKCDGHIIRVK